MTSAMFLLRGMADELLRYGYAAALLTPRVALLRVLLLAAVGGVLWKAMRLPRRARGTTAPARGTRRPNLAV